MEFASKILTASVWQILLIEGTPSLKTRRNGLSCLAFALIVLASVAAPAQQLSPALQSAIGHWQVINDDGKPWGQVEIYLVEGKLVW